MNMDCQWVESHLEAIFYNTLAEEENRLARAHIESCAACRNEVQALIAIDPVIKKYFQTQLAQAVRTSDAPARGIRKFRWGFQTAAVAVVAVVLVVLLRTPQANQVQSPVAIQTAAAPPVSVDGPPVDQDKNDAVVQTERAKPAPDAAAEPNATDRSAGTPPAAGANAPAFLVSDPAGYSHSIQDYRGFKVLVGVWSPNQPKSIAALERVYKTFGSDPTLRFIGVSPQRARKPANTTFPVFSNQGSQLMGAKPGEFVLLNESGTVIMRGLLAEDFEILSKTLRDK
jgi:hypothetical protein